MHIVYMSKGKMQGSIPLMGLVCELHYVGFIFFSDIIIIIIIIIIIFKYSLAFISSVYIFMLRPFYLLSFSMFVYFLHLLFSFPFMFYSLFASHLVFVVLLFYIYYINVL